MVSIKWAYLRWRISLVTHTAKRKRGRPKKPAESETVIGEGLELHEIKLLLEQITATFPAIEAAKVDQMAQALSCAACMYRSAVILKKRWRGHKTRKPNIEISTLVADCGRAYADAAGKTLKSWSALNRKGVRVEPPAFRLTRIVVEVATGKPWLRDLRRQGTIAKKITYKDLNRPDLY